MTTSLLVLGPMMRYVDETSASIWVETQDAARVSIRAGGRDWAARTFASMATIMHWWRWTGWRQDRSRLTPSKSTERRSGPNPCPNSRRP